MNRQRIIALLVAAAVTYDEKATDEQLITLLEQTVKARKTEPTPPAPAPKQEPTPPAPGNVIPMDDATSKRIAALESKYEGERKTRIEGAVDAAVGERRVLAAHRDNWVRRAMADETVIADLQAMPVIQPDAGAPLVVIVAEDPKSIERGIKALRAPCEALIAGNQPDCKAIARNARETGRIINANMARLMPILNAHSVDSNLQLNVILQQGMRAFKRRIIALNAFSTVFGNIPLMGTDKIEVPYYPLFTTASTDFDQAAGYVFAEDSVTNRKEVTINKRKYQPFQYNSSFLARQPYFDVARLFTIRAEQLGVDVFTDVLGDVTVSNFGASVKAIPADAFTPEDVTDIDVICEQADWPDAGRALILDSAYRGNVAKNMLKVNEAGSDSALREGVVGVLSGFDVFSSPRIPDNSEHLKGMAVLPSALLVATSPIMPGPGVRKQLVNYMLAVDPDTGATIEYRFWGDAGKDQDREVVECNYGHGPGELAALKRITDQ